MNKKKLFLYKDREAIYTDPSSGVFNNIRILSMSFVFSCFFIMPWITWNGSQAFLFDVVTARLYFLGKIFWPEDFFLFAIFFIILVLLLFAVTVYAGRLWCGFLCPQSIWIRFGMFFSRIIEGNRNARKKLDNKQHDFSFFIKKISKHSIWFIFSFFSSVTFIGYFTPIIFLLETFKNGDFYYWSWFWVIFFTFLTYFNISWFKEQFCFLVCPYARLQSVMFDENTLIVAYNFNRGEKRGARKRNEDYKMKGLGDCIDCKKCVTCCPTGIDIRNGLQMECIGCAACIDACNEVMKKLSYEQNLIGYMREIDLTKRIKSFNKIRLTAYISALCLLFLLLVYNILNRNLIHFNIIRSQLQLYNIRKDNLIENFYVLKITNKTAYKNEYNVFINDKKFEYLGPKNIILNPEESILIDVKLLLLNNNNKSKFIDIEFCIQNINNKYNIVKKSKFVIPI